MFNSAVRSVMAEYVRDKYREIRVQPGLCRMNFRCHLNVVHDAIVNNEDKVCIVIYIDTGRPVIHFLNFKDGVYFDNTLGQWSTRMEYYFVRFVNKEDFFNIMQIFKDFRKEIRSVLPWYVRLTNKIFI